MKKKVKTRLLCCPDCGSDRVTVEYVETIMANTWEHYCHSVKPHDSDSNSHCLSCGWNGIRAQLVFTEDNPYD